MGFLANRRPSLRDNDRRLTQTSYNCRNRRLGPNGPAAPLQKMATDQERTPGRNPNTANFRNRGKCRRHGEVIKRDRTSEIAPEPHCVPDAFAQARAQRKVKPRCDQLGRSKLGEIGNVDVARALSPIGGQIHYEFQPDPIVCIKCPRYCA